LVATACIAEIGPWRWFVGCLGIAAVGLAIQCFVRYRRLKALWSTTGVILMMREAFDKDLGESDEG